MKKISFIKIVLAVFLITGFTACKDKEKEAEEKQEQGVGDVYNEEEQGVQHENRDNQFPESRNDNKEGNGLETGAPTDTIDNDGDKVKH